MKNLVYLSAGSAGMGLFSYVGLLTSLYNNDMLSNLKGCVGCSAGSIICLMIATEVYKKDMLLIYDMMISETLNAISKPTAFGLSPDNFGKNIGYELTNLVHKILELAGFNKNITLKDLQKHTNIKLTFVTCDLVKMKPFYIDVDSAGELSVAEAIVMSSAVPFLTPPIHYKDMMLVDGACIENINTSIYDINDTLFLLSINSVNEPSLKPPDMVQYWSLLLTASSKQVEVCIQEKLKDKNVIIIHPQLVYNYVEMAPDELTREIQKLIISGYIIGFEIFHKDIFNSIGFFVLFVSRLTTQRMCDGKES